MFDAIIIGIYIYTIRRGMRLGTLLDFVTFGSITLSLLIAILFSGNIVEPLKQMTGYFRLSQVLSFAIFFVCSMLFLNYLGNQAYRHVKKSESEKEANKLGGILLGLLNGFLISFVMTIFIAGIYGGKPDGPDYIQGSFIGKPMYGLVTKVFHLKDTADEPEEEKFENIQKKNKILREL